MGPDAWICPGRPGMLEEGKLHHFLGVQDDMSRQVTGDLTPGILAFWNSTQIGSLCKKPSISGGSPPWYSFRV